MQLTAIRETDLAFGLLGFAILGESPLDAIAQLATLTYFIHLPRPLPAPQTFLRMSRLELLETITLARAIGIESRNSRENIHYVAHASCIGAIN